MKQTLPSVLSALVSKITTFKKSFVLLAMLLLISGNVVGQSSANYAFSTNTTGSLALLADGTTAVDMTTGTTQLVAASSDQGVSSVTNIGFDFYLMAGKFTQFSTSANGLLQLGSNAVSSSTYVASGGTATLPVISAFAGDSQTGSSGKIHYKVIGSTPNRCLVVEYLNMNLYYANGVYGNDATFQVRLYETSGVIEFVYGTVVVSSITGSPSDYSPGIGFSTGATANLFTYVTISTNTATTTGTFTDNPNSAVGVITNLNSAINGSRRVYKFTPPQTIATPTSLNFTSITSSGMRLNWTAASPATGVVGYAVYYSSDSGVTYNLANTTLLGTNTLAVTGLVSGTNYLWKVYSFSEAVYSSALSGSQATNSEAVYSTAGTYSFIVPDGVCSITVQAWGAGGGGGISTAFKGGGGGGGGGAYATKIISVTGGSSIPLVVGAGGTGNTSGLGGNGGNSLFNSNSVIAIGGSGGGYYNSTTAAVVSGGTGGAAASCIPISGAFSGGNGANPPSTFVNATTSGGSGASAGTSASGLNASISSGGLAVTGGVAGVAGYSGGVAGGGTGTDGLAGGGGGSGSRNSGSVTKIAGAGGIGKVIISWSTPTVSSTPTVNSGLCPGATNVSGTSTEATGATVTIYKNGTAVGTTTTISSNNWSVSGLSALASGDLITAKVLASCKTISLASTAVTVKALSVAPTLTSLICNAAITISGTSTEADGTTITVYNGGVSLGTSTVASGEWTLTGLSSIATNDIITAKALASGKCESTASTSVTVNACSDPLLTAGTLTSFGNQCTTTTSSPNSFTISAINLTTADLTIASLSGYSFCLTSGGSYTSTLTIPQSGGTLASTSIFVKFTPTLVQTYNGNIDISGGGLATNVTVAASGTGIYNLAGLSHTSQLVSYCVGSAITTNTATLASTGGTVTYSVSPTLPVGLALNANTGAITGTPTVATATADYVVTASNGCSTTTSTINITVLTAMSGLTYMLTSATYCAGSAITANAVTAVIGSGTIIYSVSPALPAGLALNTSTGEITGTPTTATASASYTVTASNGGCLTTKALTIVINALLNGTYTVGSGGDYTTLTAAVTAYNSACLSGPVVFSLTGTTYSTSETFPLTINANNTANSTNTLTIKPASGVAASISGAVASNALLKITAKFVTIDGSNSNGGTTRNLTITNTSATSPTVILIGNSGTTTATALTDVTLKNTILINGANTSSAVIIANNAAAAGYFRNITIQNNSIQKAYIGIDVLATAATGNGGGLLITGNDLNATGTNAIAYIGIYVEGVDGATVSNNNIANITSTTEDPIGIWFATATNSGSISGNTISTLSFTGTGAFAPVGIFLTSGTTVIAISVSNNTISSLTSSGTGTTSGIYTSSVNLNIYNNKISNIKNTNTTGYGSNGLYLDSTSITSNTAVFNNIIFDVASYGYSTVGVGDNGYGIIITSGGGFNLYNNTINLNTNQIATSGVTAAINVTSGVTGVINLLNNILLNTQTIGNRYSIYCAAASSIFGTINYNDYYSTGTNLGYRGSARVTLANLVTGFGGNANSVSVAPTFTSATDLHLSPVATASGNAALKAGTYISSVLTDYDGETRNTVTPAIGADEIFINGFWSGATSTVWDATVTGNWDGGTLPVSGADIVVPAVVTNSPVLTGVSPTIGKLNLGTGKTLTLGANTLTINGAISGSGTLTGSATSSLAIGGTAGSLNFTSGSRILKDLTLNASATATLGTLLSITDGSSSGTVTIGTGAALATGDKLTLKSDANGTARVAPVLGSITGNVTVERYIPAKRAWRALTAPLKGSDKSIFNQWQNNGIVTAGTGVELWGPAGTGSAGNGLAVGPSNSMLQYVAGAWVPITDTNTTKLFTTNSNNAFMVFPTGGYGSNLILSATNPVATTLKATGQLITGQVDFLSLPSASHTLIGNPYASPLDIATMLGANTGFSGYVWVWDANLVGDYSVGGYNLFDRTVGASGNYSNLTDNTGISGAQIQSGQAFFVKPTTNLSTFTIQESHKGSAFSNAVFRNATSAEVLRVGLYKQTNNQWSGRDGAMAVFLSDAEANPITNKMANGSENVAFTKNGILFASEHHLPLIASDVLNVKVWNTTAGANYKLKINTEQFATTNLNATLEDVFTNSRTPIALDGTAVEYPFAVTAEAASTGNRFRIVFETNALGINNPKASGITILPNPITGDAFQVNLGTLGIGTYAYTISNALGQEVEEGSINNVTQNTSYTVKFKNATAAGMYIMKVIGADNSVFTAKLIKK